MEILYDTVNGVDVEKRIYKVCQICWMDMFRSGDFRFLFAELLMDQVDQTEYYYILDNTVQCDSLDPDSDMESICSMQQ